MSNPHVNLRKPDLAHWGPLETTVHKPASEELLAEVRAFYDSNLVPELVCSTSAPARPSDSWMRRDDIMLVTTRHKNGELLGCWLVKDNGGIYYPCLNIGKGAAGALPIFRALTYASFKTVGESMHASTDNPTIQRWTNYISDTPEEGLPDNMPLAKFNGNRVEWRS